MTKNLTSETRAKKAAAKTARARARKVASGLVRTRVQLDGGYLWLLRKICEESGWTQSEVVSDLIAQSGGKIPNLRHRIADANSTDVDLHLTVEEVRVLRSKRPALCRGGVLEHLFASHVRLDWYAPAVDEPEELSDDPEMRAFQEVVLRQAGPPEPEPMIPVLTYRHPGQDTDIVWPVHLETHPTYDKYAARAAIRAAHRKKPGKLSNEHEAMLDQAVDPSWLIENSINRAQSEQHAAISRAYYEAAE